MVDHRSLSGLGRLGSKSRPFGALTLAAMLPHKELGPSIGSAALITSDFRPGLRCSSGGREICSRTGARHYTAVSRETRRGWVILEPQLGAELKRARPADLIQRIQTAQSLIQHLRR